MRTILGGSSRPSRLSTWTPRGALTLLLVYVGIVLLTRSSNFFITYLCSDEGWYSTIAARLLDGKRLYVDVIDNKPPLIYWLYSLVFAVAGRFNLVAVRLVFDLVIVATALVLNGVLRDARGGRDSALPGLLYIAAVSSYLPYDMFSATAEVLFNLPIAFAFYAAIRASRSAARWWLPLAGLACGLAVMVKLPAGVAWLSITMFLIVQRPAPHARSRLSSMAIFQLGFLSSVASVLAILRIQGLEAFRGFFHWAVQSQMGYIADSRMDLADQIRNLLSWGTGYAVAISYLVFGLVQFVRSHRREPWSSPSRLILLGLLSSLWAISVGGRFFPHYYIQALPFLCVLAAPSLASWGHPRRVTAWVGVPCLCFSLLPFFPGLFPRPPMDDRLAGEIRYVEQFTRPSDAIFVWGAAHSPVYFHSRRRPASRFVLPHFITREFPGLDYTNKPKRDLDAAAVQLLEADLEASRPAVIIDMSKSLMKRYPLMETRLAGLIERDYYLAAEFPLSSVYQRTAATGTASAR